MEAFSCRDTWTDTLAATADLRAANLRWMGVVTLLVTAGRPVIVPKQPIADDEPTEDALVLPMQGIRPTWCASLAALSVAAVVVGSLVAWRGNVPRPHTRTESAPAAQVAPVRADVVAPAEAQRPLMAAPKVSPADATRVPGKLRVHRR